MNPSFRRFLLSLGAALYLTCGLAAFASDNPPDDTDSKSDTTQLREIGKPGSTHVDADKSAATDTADADDEDAPPPPPAKHKGLVRVTTHRNSNDRVTVMGNTSVAPGEIITGDCVAVMGNMRMEGEALHDCVAVMGNNYINGPVHGSAVAVMGDLHLGPKAVIEGDVSCVGGQLIKDEGAVVRGNEISQLSGMPHFGLGSSTWLHQGLGHGRMLVFAPETHFLTVITVATLLISVLLVLAFPRGIAACGDVITHRFGATVLTGLISILAIPFLFILLLVTVVGIPVALLLLPLAIVAAKTFGTAALLVLIGQSIFGKNMPAAVCFIILAVVMVALLATPIVGLPVYLIISFLGFSSAITALFGVRRATPMPVAAAATPFAAAVPVAPAAFTPVDAVPLVTPVDPAVAAEAGAIPPPVIPVAAAVPIAPPVPPILPSSLPLAGFWIRICALAIDAILVAVFCGTTFGGKYFLFWLAVYGALLWKLKGATVGDIVFHMKVVRVDGRPIDWPTAVVRALGCFISMICACLGFIWIAFDPEKQGWHDKIAGTIVVQSPKPTPMV